MRKKLRTLSGIAVSAVVIAIALFALRAFILNVIEGLFFIIFLNFGGAIL